MKQEDKELSFIDISGRLHYGVIVNYKENEYDHRKWEITSLHTLSYSKSGNLIDTDYDGWISYEEYEGCGMSTGSTPFRFGEVLPYLRPMSSMTEEEKEELLIYVLGNKKDCELFLINDEGGIESVNHNVFQWINFCKDTTSQYIDWLNAHHFDFRGLIEKGLAIEVTKENNPYERID